MVTHHGSCFNHSQAELQTLEEVESLQCPRLLMRTPSKDKLQGRHRKVELVTQCRSATMRRALLLLLFCLSSETEYDVCLKLLREQV